MMSSPDLKCDVGGGGVDEHYEHLRMLERDLRGLVELVRGLQSAADATGADLAGAVEAAKSNLEVMGAIYADASAAEDADPAPADLTSGT